MRKYFVIITIIASCQPLFAQNEQAKKIRREIDSLEKILPRLSGTKKVDCLNTIAHKFFYAELPSINQQMDSSYKYVMQAFTEAKRMGYKKGFGYAYSRLISIDNGRFNASVYPKKPDSSYLKNAKKNIEQTIKFGEELNDNILLGIANWKLSWLAGVYNDWLKSIEYLKKTAYHFEKAEKVPEGEYKEQDYADCSGCNGNELWLATVYNDLSQIYFEKLKDISSYMDALEKSNAFIKKTGDKEREMISNFRLTGFYLMLGDFESAFEYCQRNIQLSGQVIKQTDNRWSKWASGQSFSFMSELYETAGDYETALYYARKAHDHYPKDSASNVVWSAQIGDIFRAMGNHDSALFYLRPFATNIPEPIINAMLTNGTINLCKFYNSLNQYDKSLPLITTIMNRATSATAGWGDGLLVSGNTYFGLKNYQKALSDTRTALDQFRKFLRKERIMDSYKLLSQIFHDLGNNDSAYYYLKQYTVLKDSLFKNQFYFMLNSYKKQAEEERKTSQLNLLNKDNQLKEQKLKQEATVKNSLIAGLILLLLLGIFIFRNLTQKRKAALEKQRLESEKRQAELQQRATELEMQALRAQMNPHFIFNCLSSINKFILKNDTEAASDYLTRFSRLIRFVLTNSQLSLIPLSDEIEMLRLYLDMERLRFSDSFDYNISYENTIEPETIYIPPMLLQPFCENAIWHGLMHKQGQGRLEVMMSINDSQLQCIIADNGIGREKAAGLKTKSGARQKSFGLKITTERLALFNNEKMIQSFYKTDDVFDADGNVAGTKVTLNIKLKTGIKTVVNSS